MQSAKFYEILSSYNRYWSTGKIDAGIKREILPACLGQLNSKEVIVLIASKMNGLNIATRDKCRAKLVTTTGGEFAKYSSC